MQGGEARVNKAFYPFLPCIGGFLTSWAQALNESFIAGSAET